MQSLNNSTIRPLRSPADAQKRCDRLAGAQQTLRKQHAEKSARLAQLGEYLAVSDSVGHALEKLGEQLFGELVQIIESQLTRAVQEILEQPIELKVDRQFSRGAATLSFHIEREGQREDIMRGQGGSVANILSVGLRMLALTTLDPAKHRRFLVLDEQDCWLAPPLVARLVKMVHEAGAALGFQVLMISHHDTTSFERFADRIYRCTPTVDGVEVRLVGPIENADTEI
ncbi:MAG TPA: hypothetical protein VH370_05650 [Humisphaera sp.]|jgi:hypothetical protein|nr:hypothetical protein [Humisphaera sp.]